MEEFPRIKISLKDICEDISSKLSNGIEKVIIISPNDEEADKIINFMKEATPARGIEKYLKCEVNVCSKEEHSFIVKKYSGNSKIYHIDLHRIEITQDYSD